TTRPWWEQSRWWLPGKLGVPLRKPHGTDPFADSPRPDPYPPSPQPVHELHGLDCERIHFLAPPGRAVPRASRCQRAAHKELQSNRLNPLPPKTTKSCCHRVPTLEFPPE